MLRTLLAFACTTAALAQTPEIQEPPRGLIKHDPAAFDGYTLFSPLDAAGTYLIDNDGRVIHFWDSEWRTGACDLLPNGNLLRPTSYGNVGNGHFKGGGAAYGVQEVAWDGTVLWEFVYSSDQYLMHHDIEALPNGNVLILAWEQKSKDESIAAGRDPELIGDDGIWPEHVIEVKPTRPTGGEVVWQWHIWDHLVQDFDETKANYAKVEEHPELLDINPPGLWMDRISEEEKRELEALGYLGGDTKTEDKNKNRRSSARNADWLHTNAIAYNADLDQIALSVLGNNEIWIIDHSTTTEEAKGHTGGRSGKGGDLLYRWGNPFAYRLGAEKEQTLFAQHDVNWIPKGYPGEGNLLIFNNGRGRPEGNYSTVVEIVPPLDATGNYTREAGKPWGPAQPAWEYAAPNPKDLYAFFISGARRMPNGNTLICAGSSGTFFEVTPDKQEVWRYINPVVGPPGSSTQSPTGKPTNIVFRAYRYPKDHPGLAGKDLTPGPLLTDFIKENPPKAPKKREESAP